MFKSRNQKTSYISDLKILFLLLLLPDSFISFGFTFHCSFWKIRQNFMYFENISTCVRVWLTLRVTYIHIVPHTTKVIYTVLNLK